MKRFVIILVSVFVIGCGYSVILMKGRSLWIDEVRSKSGAFPGIEGELTSAILNALATRGIVFKKRCPYLKIFFLGVSSKRFLYTSQGQISGVNGVAKYEIQVDKCNGKNEKKRFSIPLNYRYYLSPFATDASIRRAIIGTVDTLSDKILGMLYEANGTP